MAVLNQQQRTVQIVVTESPCPTLTMTVTILGPGRGKALRRDRCGDEAHRRDGLAGCELTDDQGRRVASATSASSRTSAGCPQRPSGPSDDDVLQIISDVRGPWCGWHRRAVQAVRTWQRGRRRGSVRPRWSRGRPPSLYLRRLLTATRERRRPLPCCLRRLLPASTATVPQRKLDRLLRRARPRAARSPPRPLRHGAASCRPGTILIQNLDEMSGQ